MTSHYPEPEYRGSDEIREGLEWALENIVEQPGLTIRNLWKHNGTFTVEVETHHTMQDGTKAEFPQVFMSRHTAGRLGCRMESMEVRDLESSV